MLDRRAAESCRRMGLRPRSRDTDSVTWANGARCTRSSWAVLAHTLSPAVSRRTDSCREIPFSPKNVPDPGGEPAPPRTPETASLEQRYQSGFVDHGDA